MILLILEDYKHAPIALSLSPIAGAINFCPDEFQARSDEDNIRIGIHEVVHALVRVRFSLKSVLIR